MMKCAVVFAAVSLLAGVGRADVLFSNGPLVTDPTGGTGAIAGQPISQADPFMIPGSSFVFSTTGVGATISSNTAVADDFDVPAGGWHLDSVTLYAFQVSQTTPTVQTVHLNLWDATPYNAGSPGAPDPLPQPLLSQPLELQAGPGTFVAHREGANQTGTVRPVFAYTVPLSGLPNGGDLPEGHYWLEWSFEGAASPLSFVYVPLVSPRTEAVNTNARLLSSLDGNPSSPRVWFEGREGYVAGQSEGRAYALPFELNGRVPAPGGAVVLAMVGMAGVGRRRRPLAPGR